MRIRARTPVKKRPTNVESKGLLNLGEPFATKAGVYVAVVASSLTVTSLAAGSNPWHPLAPKTGARVTAARSGSIAMSGGNHLKRERDGGPLEVGREIVPVIRALPASMQALAGAPASSPPARTDPLLQAILDAPEQPEAFIRVSIRLAEQPQSPVVVELEQEVAEGTIGSAEQWEQARRQLLTAHGASAFSAQEPVAQAIVAGGGHVTYRCQAGYCLVADVFANQVEPLLSSFPQILRMDLESPLQNEAVNGQSVTSGSQFNQFTSRQYLGLSSLFFQVEPGLPFDSDGFYDSATPAVNRRIQSFVCNNATLNCTTGVPGSPIAHTTAVAGLLIGDLTDGQDTDVVDPGGRAARSGYAREGQLINYDTADTSAATAFDHILANFDQPALLNMSAGNDASDPTCTGQSARARAANDLFESGVAVFKSAGNSGHPTVSDCTVTDPGAAIGVFAVGAHGAPCLPGSPAGTVCGYQSSSAGEQNVRQDDVAWFSSRGGQPRIAVPGTEGGGRSIIGLTAPGCRTLLTDTNWGYSGVGCGTSYAAPTVAGFAAEFQEFYRTEISDFILNPAVLYVNLLLMGDRWGENGPQTSGFDGLWGAGRLRARMWNTDGLDGPNEWADGFVCVGAGAEVTVPIWDNAVVPTDIDALKVAAWWYDGRHELGQAIDNINVVVNTVTNGVPTTAGASTRLFDNKEFVYLSGNQFTGRQAYIGLQGVSVTADDAGCGQNSMRVYYAFFMEDSDRDGDLLPGPEIVPEGISPAPLAATSQVPFVSKRGLAVLAGALACAALPLLGRRRTKRT